MSSDFDYSQEAKAARDLFVSDFTTHIFYVEDTGTEIFYERLFQRLFPKLGDFQVVCLNGKANVRKKVGEPRLHDLTYIFVVDKDFDDLFGGPEADLVYLDRYSIENYLADLDALIQVLVEEYPDGMSAQKALAECNDYAAYREQLDDRLITATRQFVVARQLWLGMPNCKIDVAELIDGSNEFHPMPTLDWLAAYRSRIIEESGIPAPDIASQIESAFTPSPLFLGATTTPLFHVPGKHLLQCVLKYMGARTVQGLEERVGRALYTRILNHISLVEFAVFKERLVAKHAALGNYA